ncbi:polyprenyl synthetase family protein [soil metagenome]
MSSTNTPETLVDVSFFTEKINRTLSTLPYGENPPELYDPIRYIMQLGGKRIRPLLTLLSAHLFGDEVDTVVKPALATEVFHNFTLLHDDIMDQAPIRRGKPTVHEKWNANIAILSGDVMLVRAYELFLDVEPAQLPRVLRLFSQCAAQVCEGQQLDMNFETQAKVSIDDYLAMIRLKTAALLGFCLELGAVLGGAGEEDAEHLRQFGIDLGIAFQLQDDLLDVYGEEHKFGKRVGGDILSHKKTFLLLTALEQADDRQHQVLQQWRHAGPEESDARVAAVTEVYDQLRVREQTEEQIGYYSKEAYTHLTQVQAPAERKELLFGLARQVMTRDK